jgi:hypothetical protein
MDIQLTKAKVLALLADAMIGELLLCLAENDFDTCFNAIQLLIDSFEEDDLDQENISVACDILEVYIEVCGIETPFIQMENNLSEAHRNFKNHEN